MNTFENTIDAIYDVIIIAIAATVTNATTATTVAIAATTAPDIIMFSALNLK